MVKALLGQEGMVKSGRVRIRYNWTTGPVVGRFLTQLRDCKQIMGIRCPRCRKVYVPPDRICQICFVMAEEWVEVADRGEVRSFSEIFLPNPHQPQPPPWICALIRLDGADTDLLHIVGGVAPDRVKVGLRVRAVWREERSGSLLDILHFEPVEAEGPSGKTENSVTEDAVKKPEPITHVQGVVDIPYRYAYGSHYTRFSLETQRNKRIMGMRCPKCGAVYVIPERWCSSCYVDLAEWVEVADEGTIISYTIVHLPYPGQPKQPPYTYAMIRLDGTNSFFLHIVEEVDFKDIHIGMRVKAVWNEERKGNLYDIQYFKPL